MQVNYFFFINIRNYIKIDYIITAKIVKKSYYIIKINILKSNKIYSEIKLQYLQVNVYLCTLQQNIYNTLNMTNSFFGTYKYFLNNF